MPQTTLIFDFRYLDIISIERSLAEQMITLRRRVSLNQIGDQFECDFIKDFPSGLFPAEIGDQVFLYEYGQKVLTGIVDKIVYAREPEPRITVSGRSLFKLAEEYIVEEPTLVSEGENARYWVDYFCNLVGLEYVITSGDDQFPVIEGYPWGLQTVADNLIVLAQIMQCTMRMRNNGLLEFIQLNLDTVHHTFTEYIDGQYEVGDEYTRNVAKIWGMREREVGDEAGTGMDLIYSERRDVDALNNDRIMVVSSPSITTEEQAVGIAIGLLDHFANKDEVSSFLMVGDFTVLIGDVAQIEIRPGVLHTQFITDLASELGRDGYSMQLTLGRKAYLLPEFPNEPGGEEGEPEDPVEYQPVLGRAYALFIHDEHVYAGGYTTEGGGKQYRLEKRHITSGSVAWATEGQWSSGSMGEIRGVWADASYVFVLGANEAASNNRRIARFNATTGALDWQATYTGNSFFNRIRGDTTGVYAQVETQAWLGAAFNATTPVAKYSRVDGSLLWTADIDRPIDNDPAPDTTMRQFYQDFDVDNVSSYVLAGGWEGEDVGSDDAIKLGPWMVLLDKSTGAVVSTLVRSDFGSSSTDFIRVVDIDPHLGGIYWTGGQGRVGRDQDLEKIGASGVLAYKSGPDFADVSGYAVPSLNTYPFNGLAPDARASGDQYYWGASAGLIYVYDLWEKVGSGFRLRASAKGGVGTAWSMTLPTGTKLYDLQYYNPDITLWVCGEKDGYFYTAYRGV